MESSEKSAAKLRLEIEELKINLATVYAQNKRLSDENAKLKQENNHLTTESNVLSNLRIEMRLKLHQLESDRDDLNASLQELKTKYNKLQDKYTIKARREQAFDQFYQKQNVIPFAVAKNSVSKAGPPIPPRSFELAKDQRNDEIKDLREKLLEAYDHIAGLEFELESVHFLESENQQMRKELDQLSLNQSLTPDVIYRKTESSKEPIYEYVNVRDSGVDIQQPPKLSSKNLASSHYRHHNLNEDSCKDINLTTQVDNASNIAPELMSVASKKALLQQRLTQVYRNK